MKLVTFLKRSSGWYWKNVSKYTNWNSTVQTIQELRETGKKDKVRLLCRARVASCQWPALSWNFFSALPQRRGAGVPFTGHLPESQISGPMFPATLLGGVNWKPRISQLLFASVSCDTVSTNQSWKLPLAVCLAWQNTECTWRPRTKTDLASRSRALRVFTAWNLGNLAPSKSSTLLPPCPRPVWACEPFCTEGTFVCERTL